MKKNIIIVFLNIFFIFLSFISAQAETGPGTVNISPSRVSVGRPTNLTFGLSYDGPDSIYEVQIKIPYNWRFTPNLENVMLEGFGMQLASVYKIEGGGYQNNEYLIRIVGCSVSSGQSGQISLVDVTPPMFVASDKSSLNKFSVNTRTMADAAAEIAASPIFETYNSSAVQPVILINELCPKNASSSSDYIELYCKNDGNFGNGADIYNWRITDLTSASPDKTFGSMVVKTGNYILLKYNSNAADDVFPSLNVINSYCVKSEIPNTAFILALENASGQVTEAIVCSNQAESLNYNAITYLNTKNQWVGFDKKLAVNISGLENGYSVARIPAREDSNTNEDFSLMNYQTPAKPNGNLGIKVKMLINEFKSASTDGDFIELYVCDDGSGGGGTELTGYEISDGVDLKYVFAEGVTAKTNDYIVINYNSSASSQISRSGNVVNIPVTTSGLSKVFGAISVKNSALKILDAICYSAGPIQSETNKTKIKELCQGGYILDMAPPLVYDDADCVSIKNAKTNSSFGRNDKSVDTNSQTDFSNFVKPTPGKPNIAEGLPIAIITNYESAIYANADSELKVTIKAVDVAGSVALTSSNIISVTSDSQGTKFSEDGINYYQKLEVTLRYGLKQIYVKDSTAGSKVITLKDKFDEKLVCKLNFVVSSLQSVQINEIMYYPPSDIVKDPYDMQWVELYNSSSSAMDISGYKLKCDSKTYTFAQNTIIESYSFIVVTRRLVKANYREDSSFSNLYGDKDGRWDSKDGFIALDCGDFKLGASGGRIALTTPDDVEISVVEYNSSQGGNGDGMSLEKSIQSIYSIGNFDVDRYNFYKSGKQYGTPGKTNSKNASQSSKLAIDHSPVTESSVNCPIPVYARASGAAVIELGYRNSLIGGIYTFIQMKKIDNTNVYRTIIPAISAGLDGVDYYIHVMNSGNEVKYSPENGPDAPYKIKIIDNAPKISLTTPVNAVAPAESFFVDVYLSNAPGVTGVSFELLYNNSYLSVEDMDSSRPGTQIAVGSMFTDYFCEANEASQTEGKITFKLVDQTGSAGPQGQAARIKFKSVSNYGENYSEYVGLNFKNVIVSGSADVNVFDNKIKIGDRASAVVGINGGVVGGENQAKLIIPAGAVKTDTSFSIKKLIKSEAPATNVIDNLNGIRSIEVAYEFEPEGFKFQKPVTIEIPFTSAELSASGVSDSKYVKIYYYNTSLLAYEKIGGTLGSNKVSVKVNHLSLYMLVEDQSKEEFALSNVFVSPNPFSPNDNGWNDSTFINYTMSVDANVTIKIFDVRGCPVKRLLNGESVSGGQNKAEWDGRDDFGRIVKTGVYVYQLKIVTPAKTSKTFQGTIVVSKNLKD